MRISVNRPSYDYLEFAFSADHHDAYPPMDSVYITGPKLGRLRDAQLCAIGYILTKDLVSNTLTFEGIKIPAFLANAITSCFDTELFLSPITTTDTAIAPKLSQTQHWPFLSDADGSRSDFPHLAVTEHTLGFVAPDPDTNAKNRITYYTNAALFLALSSLSPRHAYRAALACILYDVHGAQTIVNASAIPDEEAQLLSGCGFILLNEEDNA